MIGINIEDIIDNSKYILSNYGWSYKKETNTRRISLVNALVDYPKDSIINALSWVSNVWNTRESNTSDVCQEDIEWLNRNWIKIFNCFEKHNIPLASKETTINPKKNKRT